MLNTRKPFREFKFKTDPSSIFTHRVTIGEAYSQPKQLIVDSSVRHGPQSSFSQYSSDAEFRVRTVDATVQIEIEVERYTRDGKRRTMHHSMTLPHDAALALAAVLKGADASDVMAHVPDTQTIGS